MWGAIRGSIQLHYLCMCVRERAHAGRVHTCRVLTGRLWWKVTERAEAAAAAAAASTFAATAASYCWAMHWMRTCGGWVTQKSVVSNAHASCHVRMRHTGEQCLYKECLLSASYGWEQCWRASCCWAMHWVQTCGGWVTHHIVLSNLHTHRTLYMHPTVERRWHASYSSHALHPRLMRWVWTCAHMVYDYKWHV